MVPDPFSVLYGDKLASALGQEGRTDLTVERGQWKAYECYIIHFTVPTRNNRKETVWVVPALNYSIGRIEVETKFTDKLFKASLESDLMQYAKSGIWYPKSCTLLSEYDGKPLRREVIDVLEGSFNEPIAADAFQMVGMNIPAGSDVVGFGVPNDGLYSWDGQNIVRKLRKPIAPRADGPASNKWFLITAVLLASVSGVLLWCVFYSKRSVAKE